LDGSKVGVVGENSNQKGSIVVIIICLHKINEQKPSQKIEEFANPDVHLEAGVDRGGTPA
jgi:hypothetical protein